MTEPRRERTDAARNRQAILAATERLLETRPAQDISMDQVAAEAGVGKGTIFHRFGTRTGLLRALMIERAQDLSEAIADGPPPLGPGAPDRDRVLAFLDAVIELVSRNKSLLSELAHSDAEAITAAQASSEGDQSRPVYSVWHGHLSRRLAAARPDLDAVMTAHLILGSLHSEPVLARLTAGGPDQVSAALRVMVSALLDTPAA